MLRKAHQSAHGCAGKKKGPREIPGPFLHSNSVQLPDPTTPYSGKVGRGGSTTKSVVNVVYGAFSRLASIMLEPAAQDFAPSSTTNALPSLSSLTFNTS